MSTTVREADTRDAAALSAFAERAFRATYAAFNSPEDIESYVSEAFSLERMQSELHDSGSRLLVCESGVSLIGYAHLRIGTSPAEIPIERGAELARLYVDAAWHGRGTARLLLDAAAQTAAARGCTQLWLSVWEHNDRARAFYAKSGFRQIGEQSFLLGGDRQRDLVLVKHLPS